MLYNKDKKGYNWRLIGYSYLVLGTRSEAKFEKVPSTSIDRFKKCDNEREIGSQTATI